MLPSAIPFNFTRPVAPRKDVEISAMRIAIDRQTNAAQSAFQELSKRTTTGLGVDNRQAIDVLEPILSDDFGHGTCGDGTCPEGWKDVNERRANIVYLSSLVDLSPFPRRVYIDGGAHAFVSSVENWFLSSYPQAATEGPTGFSIFAFECNKEHEATYRGKPAEFVPSAVWRKNEIVPAFYPSKKYRMMSITGMQSKQVDQRSRHAAAQAHWAPLPRAATPLCVPIR